jgi:hypothetical protein
LINDYGGANLAVVASRVMRTSRLLAVPLALAIVPFAATASAQDAYTAVYDDVKQIIETLVLKEVSQNVASRLACFTGRSELAKGCTPGTSCAPNAVNIAPPKAIPHWVNLEAITYFPQTMRLLYDGQYSSLRTAILGEAAGLAADVAYKLLTEPPVLPDASTVASSAGAPSVGAPSSATAPASTLENETSPEEMRKTKQRERGFGSASIPNSGQGSAPNAAPHASGSGSSSSGGSAALPDIDFAPLPSDQLDACGNSVKQQLADHQIGAGTPPLAQECSATNKQRNVYACYLAQALQSELQGAPSDADQNLQDALVELVGEWALGTAWSIDTFNAAAPIVRTMLNADPAKVTSRDAAQTAATALLALNTMSSSSPKPSPPSTPPGAVPTDAAPGPVPAPSTTPPNKGTKPAAPAAKQDLTAPKATAALPTTSPSTELGPKTAERDTHLADHVTALLDQWRVFHPTTGSKLNVAKFVDSMEGLTVLFKDACRATPKAPACNVLMAVPDPSAPGGNVSSKQAKVLGAGAKMAALVGLAGRGDYVDAAQLAVEDVFQGINSQCKDKDVNGTCDEYQVYERFADSVVVYVSDIGSNGTPSQAASQAFQSAGEDLVTQVANSGGIDRRQFGGGWALFIPDLSLRYSWSPSYVNNSDGTGRVLASVTTLNLRARLYRTDYFYSALKFSFVDWIAPLAEIATRKSTNVYYGNQAALVANLFNPRVDVEVGLPALSKHLLVGGGTSYRFVVPYSAPNLGTPATATSPGVLGYQYDGVWNHSGEWSQGLEFGMFAKYSM